MNTNDRKKEFRIGFAHGYPIALGYLPVSFTFGLMAVDGGLPVWLAIFISMSNLTSAGQFAGTNLIIHGGGLLEITLTTFVINIRYMLMSLSLSQKIDPATSILQRLLFAFGITDETFAVASIKGEHLSFEYLAGLMIGPFLGWSLGTALGALICSALPASLSSAMGIALYGMFIAIIIPPAKHTRSVLYILAISVLVACTLRYLPVFHFISSGFRVIITTVLAALLGASFFPRTDSTAGGDAND